MKAGAALMVCFLFFGLQGQGQTMEEVDDTVAMMLGRIKEMDMKDTGYLRTVQQRNEELETYLYNLLGSAPETMLAAFEKARLAGLVIRTSEDRRLRIYSWLSRENRTANTSRKIYQFDAGDHVVSSRTLYTSGHTSVPNATGTCTRLFTCVTRDKKVVYLEMDRDDDRHGRCEKRLTAITLDGDYCMTYPLFKQDGNVPGHSVSFVYNPFARRRSLIVHMRNRCRVLFMPKTDHRLEFTGYDIFDLRGDVFVRR